MRARVTSEVKNKRVPKLTRFFYLTVGKTILRNIIMQRFIMKRSRSGSCDCLKSFRRLARKHLKDDQTPSLSQPARINSIRIPTNRLASEKCTKKSKKAKRGMSDKKFHNLCIEENKIKN